MPTTKHKISEQCMRIIKGSDQPVASNLHLLEVKEMVGQVINTLLKVESYAILNEKDLTGDIVPAGLVIATYDAVEVVAYKGKSKCTLPATPIRLPKDMGVFHIGGVDDPFNSYIPVPAGLWQMVSDEPIISDCLGQIGYERYGNTIIFTKDLTAEVPAITEVDMRLVIMDISQYDDYAPLPIPADMEVNVITEVLKIFGVKQPPSDIVDPVSEPKRVQQ